MKQCINAKPCFDCCNFEMLALKEILVVNMGIATSWDGTIMITAAGVGEDTQETTVKLLLKASLKDTVWIIIHCIIYFVPEMKKEVDESCHQVQQYRPLQFCENLLCTQVE